MHRGRAQNYVDKWVRDKIRKIQMKRKETKKRGGTGKERLVNINLRCVPEGLRRELKALAAERGTGLEMFCVDILRNVLYREKTVRASGEVQSGGKAVLDGEGVAGEDSRGTGSGSGRDKGRGMESGDQGGTEGREGLASLRSGGSNQEPAQTGEEVSGEEEAGEAAVPQAQEDGPERGQAPVEDGQDSGEARHLRAPEASRVEPKKIVLKARSEGLSTWAAGLSGKPKNMEPFHPAPSAARHRLWLDGQPCDHPGCGKLLTTSCEGCGRIGARGTSAMGFVVDDGARDKFFRGNVELPEDTDPREATSVEFSQEMTIDEAKRRFPDRAEELELKRRKAHPVERRIEDIPRLKAALALPDNDVPWIGGNRDLDPNNPEDVAAWKERDRQAAEMLEPAPQIEVDPAVFEFLDLVKENEERLMGADPAVFAEKIDPHGKSVAAHSHVLSSTNPSPRVVDTATEAAEAALRMKKLPPTAKIAKAKKRVCKFCEGKLERWSATTLRCTGCGRNEAL